MDENRLGIIGFCMGGRVAYLMAAASSDFQSGRRVLRRQHVYAPGAATFASPFERTSEIHCAVQGHFGADDQNPSPEDMRKLDAELTKFNKKHEFYSYPNAAHAFMDNTRESYRHHADEASWPRTLEFLERHLGLPAGQEVARAR